MRDPPMSRFYEHTLFRPRGQMLIFSLYEHLVSTWWMGDDHGTKIQTLRRQGTAGRPSEPRPRHAQQAAGRQEPAAAPAGAAAVVGTLASTWLEVGARSLQTDAVW